MQELIDEHRPDLTDAKIEILWRSGWRADADGWVQIVAVKKAGDVDRALSVKADFALLLNKENFPRLSERLKTVYLHHALCHMKPMMDSDGEQKQDDKGRLQWRIVKRHDIEQFSELVTIYGNDCLQLDTEAKAAIAAAERPLIAKAEQAESERAKAAEPATVGGGAAIGGDDDSWKREPLGVLDLDDAVETYIADAGHKTIGSLSNYMAAKGAFWVKDMTVGGRRKPANFQQKVEDAWAAFWAKRGTGKQSAATAATDAKW
jgi:hypothetical protein